MLCVAIPIWKQTAVQKTQSTGHYHIALDIRQLKSVEMFERSLWACAGDFHEQTYLKSIWKAENTSPPLTGTSYSYSNQLFLPETSTVFLPQSASCSELCSSAIVFSLLHACRLKLRTNTQAWGIQNVEDSGNKWKQVLKLPTRKPKWT